MHTNGMAADCLDADPGPGALNSTERTQFLKANAETIEDIKGAVARLERVHSSHSRKTEDEEV